MGSTCSSCTTLEVLPTAKLILQNGQLREFSYPIKVRHVLPRDPTAFICHSDEIGLQDLVSPMRPEDELRLGHLYFSLPIGQLRSPMRSDEMAALAATASSALVKGGAGKSRCCCIGIPPVALDEVEVNHVVEGGGGSRRPGFTSKLCSIIE